MNSGCTATPGNAAGHIQALQGENTQLREQVRLLESALKEKTELANLHQSIITRYKGVLDNIPDGIIIIEQGEMVYVNDRACHIFGYTPEEICHMHAFEMVAAEDHQKLFEIFETYGRTGTPPLHLEFRIKKKNGEMRLVGAWSSLSVSNGVPVGHCIVIRDITDERRAVQKLEETCASLDNIIESSLDGIVVTDGDGYISKANQAFTDMLDYKMHEIANRHTSLCFVTKSGTYTCTTGARISIGDDFFRSTHKMRTQLMKNDYLSNTESYLLRKDNKLLPVEYNVVFLFNNRKEVIGSLGVVRDTTMRKCADEKLRETSQTLSALVQASPLGILLIQKNTSITLLNPAAENILGTNTKEIRDPGAAFSHQRKQLLDAVLRNEHHAGTEIRWQKQDGRIIDCSISSAPLLDSEGEVYAVMAIIEDITERKRLQQHILNVSEREQRRIGQDLHDGLGQVLTSTAFLGTILEQKLADKGIPEADTASAIVERINDTIDQASKLAKGLSPLDLEAEGLATSLHTLCDHVGSIYAIHCMFHSARPVYIDDNSIATHLYRIAQESVHNAVRHAKAENIDIRLSCNNDNIVLSIQDNGVGFAVHDRQQTGMGLNIMEYRARMINADLAVHSTSPGGTTVTCTLKTPDIITAGVSHANKSE